VELRAEPKPKSDFNLTLKVSVRANKVFLGLISELKSNLHIYCSIYPKSYSNSDDYMYTETSNNNVI